MVSETVFRRWGRLIVVGWLLVGIDLLSIRPNDDLPVEYSTASVQQNTLEELVAFAMRFGMIDKTLCIDMLMLLRNEKTVDIAADVLIEMLDLNIIAR